MFFPPTERLKRGRAAVICCPDPECLRCVSACAFGAIKIGKDGLPVSDPDRCVGCGGCTAICPEAAVRLFKDRGDGTFELTFPYCGELPEIDGLLEVSPLPGMEKASVRVLQAIPKRPNAENALIRAALPKSSLSDIFA